LPFAAHDYFVYIYTAKTRNATPLNLKTSNATPFDLKTWNATHCKYIKFTYI
jgi:hypothetical protein